jgi:signal peptidase I
MKQSQRQPSIFFNLILFLGLVVIWISFAPVKIGGQVSYVMVNGISMEPGYHTGDLVLVRKAHTYQVGDVVTYRDAEMGSYVIHRIIGIEQGLFVLKGDNNSWIDSSHPTHAEIAGKQWIHVAKLGRVAQWLRQPINLFLTIVLLGGVFMTSMISKPSKSQKGKSRQPINLGRILEGTLYLLGLIFLGFIGLSIFAFTRPLTRTADNIKYQQEGYFFYSATGSPGVYDTDTVRSGEPVFPKLSCFLNIGFAYNVLGNQLQNISGTHQLYARILDEQSGWQRTIPLIPKTAFNGSSFVALTPLDLCQVESLVILMEEETDLRANTYTLEIVTSVTMTANVAEHSINDSLDSNLLFRFDKVHFYLAENPGKDPLRASKESLASSTEANTLSLLGWKPTVLTMRAIALIGLGLSLPGLSLAVWYAYGTARSSQEALIRLKYGTLLMDVYEGALESTATNIDVASIDDLARLAERQSTMILHMTRNFLHYYLVQGSGVTYRYVISTRKKGIQAVEPIQKEISEQTASLPKAHVLEDKPSQDEMFRDIVSAHKSSVAKGQPDETEILTRITM